MRWTSISFMTDAIVEIVVDGDLCCDAFATAAALVLVQPKQAKNLTRRRTARKKHINAHETHTMQSGRDGSEKKSVSCGHPTTSTHRQADRQTDKHRQTDRQ